jgi:hypothetical protein
MKELRSFHPSRRGLDFKQLDQDFPDEQYEIFFNTLSVEIYALVWAAFLPGGSPVATQVSPWLREYPEEFIRYVELVAHPDARAGKWERLLRDGDERVNLLVAIIFRILDKRVFSPLLFGAGPNHGNILESSDTALITAEGFQRSSWRSHTVRTWLRTTKGEPPRFWQEVDRLCTQMLAMLLPFHNYVREAAPSKSISTSELYQALHDVVAYAGWLSVCIRMSPAIVSMDWCIPGEPYSVEPVNNSQEAYEASKDAAEADEFSQDIIKQYEVLFEGAAESKPQRKKVMSAARVKISVTPKVVRHKPLPKTLATKGVTSYTLMKPSVVFYEGFRLEQDERNVFVSLPDYIQILRDQHCVPRYPALAIIVVTLLWVFISYTTEGQQTWQMMQEWVQSGRDYGAVP